jgi:3D (Asp-Asp-Asp) domain-containing protein
MRARLLLTAALLIPVMPATARARPDHPTRTYATSYCLHGTMADGSRTRPRSAASNVLRLGTKIRLVGRSFYGMRRFVIRDTGGALDDGHLDLWHTSCSTSIRWGHRPIAYRLGW